MLSVNKKIPLGNFIRHQLHLIIEFILFVLYSTFYTDYSDAEYKLRTVGPNNSFRPIFV